MYHHLLFVEASRMGLEINGNIACLTSTLVSMAVSDGE